MNWISTIFSGGVDKIVDSVAGGIDELFTSDEERLYAKNMLEKIKNEAKLEDKKISQQFENEITKRWTSDNEHFITRLVRPISYLSVLVLFGGVILSDGNIGEFSINSAYIPLLETLLVTMTVAYFGSRGAEKITKTVKNKGE